eukprot:EG_transcript_17181
MPDWLPGFVGSSGLSFLTYSATDLICQGLEKRYPVLRLQRTQRPAEPPAKAAGGDDFLEVEGLDDLEDWHAVEDDVDGLLTEEGWPKGRCCEGAERRLRRGGRRMCVKLKLDWIDWASTVKYNFLPLLFYNPVGYSWYHMLDHFMPGSLVFGHDSVWHFFVKWLSSLGAWVLVYKVVRKLEFYRNADFHDRCKNLRRQKKRVRFLELTLMATTQACAFLFVDDPVWQRATYLAYETVDTLLLYFFLHRYLTAQQEAEETAPLEDDRPPYTILRSNDGSKKGAGSQGST